MSPSPEAYNILEYRIVLCTAYYPCSLLLKGQGALWTLSRVGNGSISCLTGNGCTDVSLQSITLLCEEQASSTSTIENEGALLNIRETTFSSCSSLSDGGVVRCYGTGSALNIRSSVFYESRSAGSGGAISAVGCSVTITNSTFQDCFSMLGGGAISANQFQCYGSTNVVLTSVFINFSLFKKCGSQGDGGALQISSSISSAHVVSTHFSGCWSDASGGAVSLIDHAMLFLANSSLIENHALDYGGGISGTQSSTSRILNTVFARHYVDRIGGGALFASDSYLMLEGVSCIENRADSGGGGAIFWDGAIQPISVEVGPLSPSSTGSLCSSGNTALYGSCIASAFNRLNFGEIPKIIYPGLAFPLSVSKLDFYNQTISSDSLSVLQIFTTLDDQLTPDNSITLSGNYISNFIAGIASFSVILKPSFVIVDTGRDITVLFSRPAIYFLGVDIQTGDTLLSSVLALPISSNDTICPKGDILELDNARSNSSLREGACSQCGKGTYSLNPLMGVTRNVPSCLNCFQSAQCIGGSSVNFSLGTWIVANSMYLLVACPPGHQLVNSINGAFSHDVQNCAVCATNDYILNSSNASYICQPCPVGASCDGNTLTGLIPGSVWLADKNLGIYRLVSCPPGYQILVATVDSQQCVLCPFSFYCVGGTSSSVACSDDSYAPPGSNSSSSCTPTIYVQIVVVLPLTSDEFTSAKQQLFQEALASAAGISDGYVILSGFSSTSRRTTGAYIQVPTNSDCPL